jgi:2'-5' RNA ligase
MTDLGGNKEGGERTEAAKDAVRAFIAMDFDADAIARFAAIAERLRARAPHGVRASFVAPDKMHVTVKFLGQTELALAPSLAEIVRASAARAAPITHAQRLGAFGSPKRAHVIVVELDDAGGALARLAAEIEERAAALGFAKEARAYRPHLTLARLRETTDVRKWLEAALTPSGDPAFAAAARITDLTLYRSDGAPTGSVYTPIARAPFTA